MKRPSPTGLFARVTLVCGAVFASSLVTTVICFRLTADAAGQVEYISAVSEPLDEAADELEIGVHRIGSSVHAYLHTRDQRNLETLTADRRAALEALSRYRRVNPSGGDTPDDRTGLGSGDGSDELLARYVSLSDELVRASDRLASEREVSGAKFQSARTHFKPSVNPDSMPVWRKLNLLEKAFEADEPAADRRAEELTRLVDADPDLKAEGKQAVREWLAAAAVARTWHREERRLLDAFITARTALQRVLAEGMQPHSDRRLDASLAAARVRTSNTTTAILVGSGVQLSLLAGLLVVGRWLIGGPSRPPAADRAATEPATRVADRSTEETVPEDYWRIDHYRLRRVLGRGSTGIVYEAEQPALGRSVAVKVLVQGCEADEVVRARFEREALAIGRLDHPHIVRAIDAGVAKGRMFLAMEYVDGPDLGRVVRDGGPLAVADACAIALQVLGGLRYAHRRGFVHRDLSPGNVLLTTGGVAKITDFGLALATDRADQWAEGLAVGTPAFLAPELIGLPEEVTERADFYSLGCVLYHLLTGHPPFHGTDYTTPYQMVMAHTLFPPPPVGGVRPDLPEELATFIDRLLEKSPADRPNSPEQCEAVLGRWSAGANLPAVVAKWLPAGGNAGELDRTLVIPVVAVTGALAA